MVFSLGFIRKLVIYRLVKNVTALKITQLKFSIFPSYLAND